MSYRHFVHFHGIKFKNRYPSATWQQKCAADFSKLFDYIYEGQGNKLKLSLETKLKTFFAKMHSWHKDS